MCVYWGGGGGRGAAFNKVTVAISNVSIRVGPNICPRQVGTLCGLVSLI